MKKAINIIYLVLNNVLFVLKALSLALIVGMAVMMSGVILMASGVFVIILGILSIMETVAKTGDPWAILFSIIFIVAGVMLTVLGMCVVAAPFICSGSALGILKGYSIISLLTLIYEIFTPKNWIPIPVCIFSLGNIIIYALECIFNVCFMFGMFFKVNGVLMALFGIFALADVLGIVISAGIVVFNVVYFIVSATNKKKQAKICEA